MNPFLPTGAPPSIPHPVPGGKGLPAQRETRIVAHHEEPGEDFDQTLLREAHKRFRRVVSWEQRWRDDARKELNFVDGLMHWEPDEKNERKGRPCLTFDLIGPSIDQTVNDMRQNPPEAKISPVGGKADKQTAEIIQGILRNIDQDSDGSVAWMTAYEHALKIGRGWVKTSFEYEDNEPDSPQAWLQKIVTERIANPFCIYPDPAVEKFDYSDMKFCFKTEDIDETTFKDVYPGAEATSMDFISTGDKPVEWYPDGHTIRVAEYWWVETERIKIAQLADGSTVKAADVPDGIKPINTRTIEHRKVQWALLTGAEVLDSGEWPGKWIPIIPVIGREVIVEEKRRLRGQIRGSMDANLQYDYMRSKEAEAIGLAPISQWLIAEGGIEGHEYKWADSNRKSLAYLEYKVQDEKGNELPRPIRIDATQPALVGISNAIAHAANDVKNTQATFSPELGQPSSREVSGRAILAQQKEGDNAHFNYVDNLRRSMRHDARIKIDLIPYVYSEERALSITDPDGSIRPVQLNQKFMDRKKGAEIIYRVGKNHIEADRYDATIGTGQNYASLRQEGQQALLQLIQSEPSILTRTADLVVKAIGAPGFDEIAERLKPPDIQDGDEDAPPIPPAIQQKMAQDQQVIQQLLAEKQALTETLKAKILDLESRERIATQNNQARVYSAEALSKAAQMTKLAELDHAAVKHQLDMRAATLHDQMTVEADATALEQQHQQEQQAQQSDQQHQQDLQQSDQQHQQDLQAQQLANQPEPKAA